MLHKFRFPIRSIAYKSGVPIQTFAYKSDVPLRSIAYILRSKFITVSNSLLFLQDLINQRFVLIGAFGADRWLSC